MRYIELTVDTGYAGTSQIEYLKTDNLDMHIIGHLQSNKVRKIIDVVSMIQSLDSISLAEEISEMYEYVVLGWDEDVYSYAESNGIDVEEAEQMIEDYYSDAGYSWVEISEEEYKEYTE